jgi:hypothetical protein
MIYKLITNCKPEATIGVLLDPMGNHLCKSIEPPWLDNKKDISCIPAGTYLVKKYSSQKYPNVWEVTKVTDRTAILFHWGNKVSGIKELSDSNGCIILGKDIKKNVPYKSPRFPKYGEVIYPYWVTQSMATIERLRKILPNEFLLEITRR